MDRRLRLGLGGGLVALGLVLGGVAHAADADQDKPKTRVTQVLSHETYQQMQKAQEKFDAKDYKGAEGELDKLKDGYKKLNDYEKATLWNLYAAVYRSENDNKRAVEAYNNLLQQKNLPQALRDNALFSLAQTYFLEEDYQSAIRELKRWVSLVETPQPDAYILMAQAYYQMNQFDAAKEPILDAMRIAKLEGKPYNENWLSQLRAVYYETKDYKSAAKVLEVLASQYPQKGTYLMQLSGMYGLLGDQKLQTEYMHVAYVNGLITSTGDILNMARLYMAQNAPQRAVDVIRDLMKKDKDAASDVKNIELLAQALSLARDTKESVPVLVDLAGKTGKSQDYVYLAQAYGELAQWDDAAAAYRKALSGKDVSNAADIQMQIGTVLYNSNKLEEARAAFVAAAQSPKQKDSAGNWVKFVDAELERRKAMGG
jgi:predicted Zn-dependent protease